MLLLYNPLNTMYYSTCRKSLKSAKKANESHEKDVSVQYYGALPPSNDYHSSFHMFIALKIRSNLCL